jgi:hypothetical protein
MSKKPTRPKGSKQVAVAAPKPEPSAVERKAIEQAIGKAAERTPPVAVKTEKREGKPVGVGPDHSDAGGWLARMMDAFGTRSDDFAMTQFSALVNVILPRPGVSPDDRSTNALLAAVEAVRPKDEVEAMLATQMAATHAFAMNLMGRACRAQQVPQFESAANQATKMLRTFAAQAETLAKLRRGGEQRVVVEHVHVYSGGQAIVGAVNPAAPVLEGVGCKSERQTHAPEQPHTMDHDGRAAVPLGSPALRSPDQEREPLPLSGGEG